MAFLTCFKAFALDSKVLVVMRALFINNNREIVIYIVI